MVQANYQKMPTYKFTFELDDKLSNPMMKISQGGEKAYARLIGNQEKLNKSVSKGADKLGSMSNGINKLKNIAAGFIGLQMGKTVLGWGADMEQTKIAFQTLTGSVEKGNALFGQINRFANITPFNNADLQEGAKTMLSFGISLDKVMPNLKMLGDVSMGNKEKLKSLTLAFSQVQSQGKLMGQDLLQFINAGFNPLKIISEQTGKSMAQLKDEMSKGAISADMVAGAFKAATSKGGMFFNMMAHQSETMAGKWSTFIGKVQNSLGSLVENNSRVFTSVLDGLIGVVDWMGKNANVMATFFGILAGGFALYKTWVMWQQRVAVWQAIVAATNPIGLIVAGLAALAAGVVWAWNKFEGFRGTVMGVWEVLKGLGGVIKTYVIERFKGILSGLGALGRAFKELIHGNFSEAGKLAVQGAKDLAGISAAQKAMKSGFSFGKSFKKGYAKGVAAGPVKNPLDKLMLGTGASSATAGTAPVPGAAIAGSETAGAKVSGITGGGARSTNVSISLGNLIENFSISPQTVSEGVEEMREMVTEALLRVLNSSNKISWQQ